MAQITAKLLNNIKNELVMEFLLLILLTVFTIATIIIPWINRDSIITLRAELEIVKKQLKTLSNLVGKQGLNDSKDEISLSHGEMTFDTPAKKQDIKIPVSKNLAEPKNAFTSLQKLKSTFNFEHNLGSRLPVWIGGIALAFAGFFMVKYSIEANLLSPDVRVVMGIIFGTGLLWLGNWVREKDSFSDGIRISQALSGAGIADLYACIFAASSLYELIPSFLGFFGMATITLIAMVLSLKHGIPIAAIGLLGGLLTPAMVGSVNPSAPALFTYLYFVVVAIFFIIRKKNWWVIATPVVIGVFAWVYIWLLGDHFKSIDSIYIALFLIAVSATVVLNSKDQYQKENNPTFDLKSPKLLNFLTLGGAILNMGIVASYAGLGFMEWSLFGLISIGGIGLAFFDQKLYGLVPWFSLMLTTIIILTWHSSESIEIAWVIGVFGSLYMVSGYLLQSRSKMPLLWANLVAASSVGYYLIGILKLYNTNLIPSGSVFWWMLAFTLSIFSIFALAQIIKLVPENHPDKQKLMAIYASTSTAFLSIGLAFGLHNEFLLSAISLQIFALAWISTKISIKALRHIANALFYVLGVLIISKFLPLIDMFMRSLVSDFSTLPEGFSEFNWLAFQLFIPATFLILSSYIFRTVSDDSLTTKLEIFATALFAIFLYLITHKILNTGWDNYTIVEFFNRGVIHNVLFLYGLACLWVGKKYVRVKISISGLVICLIAMCRIIYFDLIIYNPLFSYQSVGQLPLINSLLITYGAPILWTYYLTKNLPIFKRHDLEKYCYALMFLLVLVFVSFNVRQIFHGTYLNGNETTTVELYSYSIAWLLLGVTLLLIGTFKKNKSVRIYSLFIMILTVGKVFLYDASELDGLLRVLSFFGLGLSLLGLSWFYTRFIFQQDPSKTLK